MAYEVQIDSQVRVYANSSLFPAIGKIRTIYIDKAADVAYYWNDTTSSYHSLGGASASVVWGSITGLLSDQTDLQNALDTKVPYTGATANVNLGEYQIKAGQVELDQTPTGTTGVAKMRWNDTDGTVDIGLKGGNVTLQVGLEELVRVVNKSGASIAESAYQAVRVRLVSEGGASGQRLAVVLAQANNDLNSATTIGIVTETIANNAEGFINRGGEVREINTTGALQGETWVDGDILYLSPTTPGALTNIKPTAPDHSITIGYVVYAHAVHGKIFVKVDNGYELEELHNVTSEHYTTPEDEDSVLTLDSTQLLWKRLTLFNLFNYLKSYFDSLYQGSLNLTTTGTSGAATLVGSTLNIPQYSGGGGGGNGVHALVKPKSGLSTTTMIAPSTLGTLNVSANRMYAMPFIPNTTFTTSSFYINITNQWVSSSAKIMIYSNLDGLPDALLYESTNLDCSTTGIKTATTTFTFNAGTTYWFSFWANATVGVSNVVIGNHSLIGFNGITVITNYIQTVTFGSAPNPFGTTVNSNGSYPFIGATI